MTPDLEVEVGAGDVPRAAAEADNLPFPNLLTLSDVDGGEMCIDGHKIWTMVQPDHLTVSGLCPGKTNPTSHHGSYLGSFRNIDIYPPV